MAKPPPPSKSSLFKKGMKILLILIISLVIASLIEYFIKYSNPDLNTPIPPTDKLDVYLQTEEAKVKGIIENTEKTIEWYAKSGQKTEYSIVYLHGFSATRQETAPLTSLLGKELKANVFHTRLAGHGLDDERMVEGSLKAWKQDTLEAYAIAKELGEKIIIVSVSTGGTLSTWLADELKDQPHKIAAQILVSPNFEARDKNMYILDWPLGIGLQIAKLVTGKDKHEWEPHNELQDKYWSNHYRINGVRPLAQLMKEVKSINKQNIKIPSLFIYSSKDTVVSTQGITKTFAEYGSSQKEIIVFDESGDPSNHVLAGNILSPQSNQPLLDMMTKFLRDNNIAQ